MDLMGFILLLRGPLEITAFGLALAPMLSVAVAWGSLPRHIPVHFGVNGRPDRMGSRNRAWILPLLALAVYAFMSRATGTWAWAFEGRVDLPAGGEIPLLVKPVIGLLMAYSNEMLIRIARKEADALNGWMMWGLMILLVAPPCALSALAR